LGGGIVAAGTGVVICSASGVGCFVGIPMAAIGASDAVQGGDMLWQAINGITTEGFNPIKDLIFQQYVPGGDVTYDIASLGITGGAIFAKVPLIVGATEGISTQTSLFGFKAMRWQNSIKLGPFVLPRWATDWILGTSVVSKGAATYKDANH
jgi:hypothetical protein